MKYILAPGFRILAFCNGKVKVLFNKEKDIRLHMKSLLEKTINLCDGTVDFDAPTIPANYRKLAAMCQKKGYIEEVQEGQTIPAHQEVHNVATPDFFTVQWSITSHCNAKCRHCFLDAPHMQHQDLTTKEMLKILDELADNYVTHLSLTGGEPLCRTDLPVLLEEMHKRNLKVTALSSNGFLLNDKCIELFERCGMRPKVQLSFDGVGHHDWLRGIKGAEELTIAATKACVKHGWEVTWAMCVHHGNVQSMLDTARLAAQLGCKVLRIGPVSKITNAVNFEVETYSIGEMYQIYLDFLPVFLKEKLPLKLLLQGVLEVEGQDPDKLVIIPVTHTCTDLEHLRTCTSTDNSFYLDAQGRMLPCMALAETEISKKFLTLHEHSLAECVESEAYQEFRNISVLQLLDKHAECKDCPHLTKCGMGCRAGSIIMQGDYYATDEGLCQFFKEGWEEKFRRGLRGEGITRDEE